MKSIKVSVLGLLIILLMDSVYASFAEEGVRLCKDEDYLTTESDYILEGKVNNIEIKWDEDHAHIHTYQTFIIEKYIKGSEIAGDTIIIDSIGGCAEDICEEVSTGTIVLEKNIGYNVYLKKSGNFYTFFCESSGYKKMNIEPVEIPTVEPLDMGGGQSPSTSCDSDKDCPEGKSCINDECGVIAQTIGPSEVGGGQAPSTVCVSDKDCPSGKTCVNGDCIIVSPTVGPTDMGGGQAPWTPCTSDADCNGKTCVDGDCILFIAPSIVGPSEVVEPTVEEKSTIQTADIEIVTLEKTKVIESKMYVETV